MNLAATFAKNFDSGTTAMRLLTRDGVGREMLAGRPILRVTPRLLRQLSREAFRDVNFLFRTSTLEQWSAILDDAAASANDRYVAASLLKNAAIAAEGLLPSCQDTGTATVVAFKGESVVTGGDDAAELERGAGDAYGGGGLRFSQMVPLGMCEERNTGTNLPAQIDLYATGGDEYQFMFVAKGGGSSNKTAFWQQTKALLNEASLIAFLQQQVRALGVAACPPYHLALVVGGSSPELNLKLLKLASTGALDHLPETSDGARDVYRDRGWEQTLMDIAVQTGLGAQFGGKYLAVDARVIRASRHGGSCPVSLGVSCSAHRNAYGRINSDGVFLEDFDRNPSRFLPKALAVLGGVGSGGLSRVELDQPIGEVCRQLAQHPVGTLVLLTGTMIVARDIAHARFHALLEAGRPLPEYLKRHPVYYAGPAETPPGEVIGSFGPTTAQRMDDYLRELMSHGASLVTLAKGNRASSVAAACRDYGGFYLGTIGGAAALLARDHIVHAEVVDYADLGMEAVRRIVVKDLPAFIVVDNRKNDFYVSLTTKLKENADGSADLYIQKGNPGSEKESTLRGGTA